MTTVTAPEAPPGATPAARKRVRGGGFWRYLLVRFLLIPRYELQAGAARTTLVPSLS